MEGYPLALRAMLSQLVGCLFLAVGVLWGPVDSLPRALAVGVFAGCAASGLAGFRFPGWPWFSAGLGCSLAGLLRDRWSASDWSLPLVWTLGLTLAYVLVWPLAQAFLIYTFQVETQDYEPPWGQAGAGNPLLRGVVGLALAAALSALVLLGLGPSARWFLGPASLVLGSWLTTAFSLHRPEWLLCGTLAGLLSLSLAAPVSVARPALMCNDPYWLVGQSICWLCLGYWLSLTRLTQLTASSRAA